EKAAVHQSRWTFVHDRKRDAAGGGLVVEVIEGVLGKARVVRADVERVVKIYALLLAARADPGRRIGRDRARQLALPIGELGKHGVDGRMLMLQGQQHPGQTPKRARGGDRLRQWLLAVSRCAFHDSSPMIRLRA